MNSRWLPLACFLAGAVLFFFANRSAYKGYFSDDDLDNLGWPTYVGNNVYYQGLVSLKVDGLNFRPVGDLYYRYLYRFFHLNFRPYVAVLQIFHLANSILLYFLLVRLRFSRLASGAGALFYSFHAAVLEAFWKPMYVFDLLCATFCLAALLLYLHGRWILALVPFWLAYKSKEIAIMLPAALLAYELLLGRRKWKRLIPYFLISLNFGLRALWTNQNVAAGNPYSLTLSPGVVWHNVAFYSSAILFLPFAGAALLLLPVWVRDRRLYLGFILTVSLMLPLLALAGRYNTVYWYVPLIGLAIALAAVAARAPRWAVALFFAVWLPINYLVLRERRRGILAVADENRWYTTELLEYARRAPQLKTVLYEGIPAHVGRLGVDGAIHIAFGPKVNAVWYYDPHASDAFAQVPMAMVSYYPVERIIRGLLRTNNIAGDQSYLRFRDEVPDSRLGSGWLSGSAGRRDTAPAAEVSLYRPVDARQVEIVASALDASDAASQKVTVFENDKSLGAQVLAAPGGQPQRLRWESQARIPGVTAIRIVSDRGIAVYAVGYPAR